MMVDIDRGFKETIIASVIAISIISVVSGVIFLQGCNDYEHDNKYEEVGEVILENLAEEYLGLEDDELRGIIDLTPFSEELE